MVHDPSFSLSCHGTSTDEENRKGKHRPCVFAHLPSRGASCVCKRMTVRVSTGPDGDAQGARSQTAADGPDAVAGGWLAPFNRSHPDPRINNGQTPRKNPHSRYPVVSKNLLQSLDVVSKPTKTCWPSIMLSNGSSTQPPCEFGRREQSTRCLVPNRNGSNPVLSSRATSPGRPWDRADSTLTPPTGSALLPLPRDASHTGCASLAEQVVAVASTDRQVHHEKHDATRKSIEWVGLLATFCPVAAPFLHPHQGVGITMGGVGNNQRFPPDESTRSSLVIASVRFSQRKIAVVVVVVRATSGLRTFCE